MGADIKGWPWMEAPLDIKGRDGFPGNLPKNAWVFKLETTYIHHWRQDSTHQHLPDILYQGYVVHHNEDNGTYEFVASLGDFNSYYYFNQWETVIGDSLIRDTEGRIIGQDLKMKIFSYFWYPHCGWASHMGDPADFYDSLPPGTNIIRYFTGNILYTPPFNDHAEEIYKDAEKYSSYPGFAYKDFQIEMESRDHIPTLGSVGIQLVNEKEFKKWLPTAPLNSSDQPGELTLEFSLDKLDEGTEYCFRARLYNISWYPGKWVNDYRWLAVNKVEETEWNPKTSMVWAHEEDRADIFVDSAANPNWEIQWVGVDTSNWGGYYELQFTKPLENVKDVAELKINSRDFAATARLIAGVNLWDNNAHFRSFDQLAIYEPEFQLDPSNPKESYVLPIPRD